MLVQTVHSDFQKIPLRIQVVCNCRRKDFKGRLSRLRDRRHPLKSFLRQLHTTNSSKSPIIFCRGGHFSLPIKPSGSASAFPRIPVRFPPIDKQL